MPHYINKAVFVALFLCFFSGFAQSESAKIENLIEQKRSFNKSNKGSSAFKIQIFNGNETEAYRIKSEFETLYPDYTVKVVYKAPEWKLQIVNFVTRLDAERSLLVIKKNYIGAFVLDESK